jgi:hypothetical protein
VKREVSSIVLSDAKDDPDATAIAASLERALAEDDEAPKESKTRRIDEVDVVIALDEASADRAREAGARCIVALATRFDFDWEDASELDLVLVMHASAIESAIEAGAPAGRVACSGPIAREGWTPAADRAALRLELGLRAGSPCVVVRGAAVADDPAAVLVQLALAKSEPTWLFDVGSDPDLSRTLRRRAPAYEIDAFLFSDADALRAYQAADAVLGAIGGPEIMRALSVGAAPIALPPRSDAARIAHELETEGVLDAADSIATLAVTIDGALAALERTREKGARLDAASGARRAAELVRKLVRGELSGITSRAGLPVGLERISSLDERAPAADAPPSAPEKQRDDVDARVDDELAALRKKLGL